MDYFWKASAAVLLTVVLCLAVGKKEQDISTLLTMIVSCVAVAAAIFYLEPILSFLRQLGEMCALQDGMFDILMKSVGIALITEITALICMDAGFASLGKSLQLLGSTTILYLSLPVMKNLLDFIQTLLGEL